MTSSNVIAGLHDIRVQRNAAFEFFFQFRDADNDLIDLTTVFEILVQVRNISGKVVSAFAIGDGLTINPDDNTVLIMSKADDEKNIASGSYNWDLRLSVTDGQAQYPLRGAYIVVNNITE